MIVILIGKSASGKDLMMKHLVEDGFHPFISVTSRPMRDGEVEGKDYYFVSKNEFLNKIQNQSLLEYRSYKTLYQGNSDIWYYGSPKIELEEDVDYVTVVDLNGMKSFLEHYGSDQIYVVSLEASDEIRKSRAMQRGSFDETEWNRRLIDDNIKFSSEEIHKYANLELINENISISELQACLYDHFQEYKQEKQQDNTYQLENLQLELFKKNHHVQIIPDDILGDFIFQHNYKNIEDKFYFYQKYGLCDNLSAFSMYSNDDKKMIYNMNQEPIFFIKSQEKTISQIGLDPEQFINELSNVFPEFTNTELDYFYHTMIDKPGLNYQFENER